MVLRRIKENIRVESWILKHEGKLICPSREHVRRNAQEMRSRGWGQGDRCSSLSRVQEESIKGTIKKLPRLHKRIQARVLLLFAKSHTTAPPSRHLVTSTWLPTQLSNGQGLGNARSRDTRGFRRAPRFGWGAERHFFHTDSLGGRVS